MSFRRFCLVTIFLGCTAAAWPQPAPGPEAQGERAAAANNVQAPIKIVEFLDYQCPFCAKAEPELRKLLHIYDGRVQLIVKHDPLPIHPDSMLAHEAALAAANQGKFWEMHDLLFANPRKVGIRDLLGYAAQLQLDLAAFEQDLKTHRYHEQVLRDMALAQALGVSGTPTFFINGRKVLGAQSASALAQAIDSGLG